MSEDASGLATLTRKAGVVEARLTRRIDHPPALRVSVFEDGRLVEYSWSSPGEPQRPVRWEVAPEGEGARLTLTLTVPAAEDPGRACAGWEAHLEMLQAALEGVPIKFPFESFQAAREAYRIKVAEL